jgi:hypothetical protein|tara:strand:- start:379 stop:543 length:165 start_codon:yes stop_codon:yes gene_type:complete
MVEVKHYYHIMVTSDGKFMMVRQDGSGCGDVQPVHNKPFLNLSEVFDVLYKHVE